MYLTGGQYKGYKIDVPKSAKPTLSKVRESVFNILFSFDFSDNLFLDMFSGSGIMALEAASRGYKVDALEINKDSYRIIKKNFEKIGLKPSIILTDALKYKTDKKYNIIYIDPPWKDDYISPIKKAFELLNSDGVIIIEHDYILNQNLEDIIKKSNIPLKLVKSKKYGRCLIDLLMHC